MQNKHKPENLSRDYGDMMLATDVFSQVFPEHKFLIVECLRELGYKVGMTGDGVNDAPALKRADVGIAVKGATEAAQSAAAMVLTQPGLSTIISGIIEARCIFRRIRNFILYRIAATLQLLVFFFIAVFWFKPGSYFDNYVPANVAAVTPVRFFFSSFFSSFFFFYVPFPFFHLSRLFLSFICFPILVSAMAELLSHACADVDAHHVVERWHDDHNWLRQCHAEAVSRALERCRIVFPRRHYVACGSSFVLASAVVPSFFLATWLGFERYWHWQLVVRPNYYGRVPQDLYFRLPDAVLGARGVGLVLEHDASDRFLPLFFSFFLLLFFFFFFFFFLFFFSFFFIFFFFFFFFFFLIGVIVVAGIHVLFSVFVQCF